MKGGRSMKYNDIITAYNVDEAYLHNALGIPYRTLKSWRLEEREAPNYVMELLAYFIFNEMKEGRI